ncbi:MAG: hypothetical protein NZL83_00850 [Candidatus Absconditabacterales bacterium]|nr:hypothetical protein [Candidatus Absconditabacterales bacterium]
MTPYTPGQQYKEKNGVFVPANGVFVPANGVFVPANGVFDPARIGNPHLIDTPGDLRKALNLTTTSMTPYTLLLPGEEYPGQQYEQKNGVFVRAKKGNPHLIDTPGHLQGALNLITSGLGPVKTGCPPILHTILEGYNVPLLLPSLSEITTYLLNTYQPKDDTQLQILLNTLIAQGHLSHEHATTIYHYALENYAQKEESVVLESHMNEDIAFAIHMLNQQLAQAYVQGLDPSFSEQEKIIMAIAIVLTTKGIIDFDQISQDDFVAICKTLEHYGIKAEDYARLSDQIENKIAELITTDAAAELGEENAPKIVSLGFFANIAAIVILIANLMTAHPTEATQRKNNDDGLVKTPIETSNKTQDQGYDNEHFHVAEDTTTRSKTTKYTFVYGGISGGPHIYSGNTTGPLGPSNIGAGISLGVGQGIADNRIRLQYGINVEGGIQKHNTRNEYVASQFNLTTVGGRIYVALRTGKWRTIGLHIGGGRAQSGQRTFRELVPGAGQDRLYITDPSGAPYAVWGIKITRILGASSNKKLPEEGDYEVSGGFYPGIYFLPDRKGMSIDGGVNNRGQLGTQGWLPGAQREAGNPFRLTSRVVAMRVAGDLWYTFSVQNPPTTPMSTPYSRSQLGLSTDEVRVMDAIQSNLDDLANMTGDDEATKNVKTEKIKEITNAIAIIRQRIQAHDFNQKNARMIEQTLKLYEAKIQNKLKK